MYDHIVNYKFVSIVSRESKLLNNFFILKILSTTNFFVFYFHHQETTDYNSEYSKGNILYLLKIELFLYISYFKYLSIYIYHGFFLLDHKVEGKGNNS